MPPKTKFNLLLDPDQIAALREIQAITGAPLSEQIRRAIDEWIATRGLNPQNPVCAELRELAAMPTPKTGPKRPIHAAVKRAEKTLRKSLVVEQELAAIRRGERTEQEAERFLAKATKPARPRVRVKRG